MKALKYSIVFIFYTVPFCIFSQPPAGTSTSGGTITVNSSEAGVNIYQRDEVHVPGGSADIHITPNTSNTDAHLYLDPTIILPTTYAAGGVNTGTSGLSGSISTIDNTLPVGTTPGSFAVSNGAATYNIPIIIPPGTAGMTPNISLQYNSYNQNGILGGGWSLHGTSAIIRVDKNIYHDNTCQAVLTAPASDAFSLDGNRLIQSGTPNSFVSENEDFSIITYITGSGNSGDYYTVQTTDGKTMEYGSSVNSKIQFNLSGTVYTYAWYLTKVYDNYGNTIAYNYNKNPTSISGITYNELVLSEIDYTLNSIASPNITAYNSIKFDYEQRSDIDSRYIQGHVVGSTLLLRQIEVDCEGVFMKKYAFAYAQNAVQESYLNKITEYGSDNTNLNSTVIDYAQANKPALNNSPTGPFPPTPVDSELDYWKLYMSGDFNGDGRSDLLGFSYNTDVNDGSINYSDNGTLYLNNDNGITYTQYQAGLAAYSNGNSVYFTGVPSYIPESGSQNVVDVNGDGRDDIIVSDLTGIKTYVSTGTTFTLQSTFSDVNGYGYNFSIADINGDGLPEAILFYPLVSLNGNPATFYGNSTQSPYFKVLDLLTGSSQSQTTNFFIGNIPIRPIPQYYYTDINEPATVVGSSIGINNTDSTYTGIFTNSGIFGGLGTIDFDGDGLSEFLTGDGSNYYVLDPMYSAGSLQGINIIYQFPVGNSNDLIYICDFNGDGISDYITISQYSGPIVHFGTGVGVTSGTAISNAPGFNNQVFYPPASYLWGNNSTEVQYLVADVNGDSKSDLVYFNSAVDGNGDGTGVYMSVSYGGGNINNVNPMSAAIGVCHGNIPTYEYFADKRYIPEFSTGDFDGDGNEDILFKRQVSPQLGYGTENPNIVVEGADGSTDSRWIINPYAGNATRLATSITNGNNITININYNTISAIDNDYIANNSNPITGTYIASKIYTKGSNTSVLFPIVQIQKPITVVTSVSSPNGGEINFLNNGTTVTTYTYADAQIQVQGKGYLGFSKTIESNSSGIVVTKIFENITKIVSSSQTIIEKVPLSLTTVSSYTLADELTNGWYDPIIGPYTSTATYQFSVFPLSTSSLQHFTAITNKSETDYTGANTVTTYTYDNNITSPTNNNITTIFTTIGGNLETYSVTNTYQSISSFSGIPCRLSDKTTIVNRIGQPQYKRGTSYEYTNKGSIWKIHQDPTNIVPGSKNVDITYTYDSGNHGVLSQKQAVYNGTGGITKTINYSYDANYRYAIKVANPLGQTSEVTYDPKWGQPLTLKGIDNLTTSYTYDGYGKNIEMITPDGLINTTTYEWVQPGESSTWNNDPIDVKGNLLYKVITTSQGKPTVNSYNDMYGRIVKTISEGFNNTSLNMVRSYDMLGNVYKQSNIYDPSNSQYQPVVTLKLYDNFGNLQILQTEDFKNPPVNREDYSNNINYTYTYSAGTKTVTEVVTAATGNKTSIKIYDATGLLTTSSGDNPTVNYSYGSHHMPISIDMGGPSIVSFTYDAYARKSSLTESNTGTTIYDFSALGLLNSKTDNSAQTYNYTYDVLDRPSTVTFGPDVYTYQYVPSGSNGVNQIQKVTVAGSSNIEYDYTYDALNRQVEISEHLGGAAGILSTNFTYDQYNNLSKVVYPGGNFAINKLYDQHGYLKQITRADNNNSIWQANTVNPMGQYDNYTLGNNINVQKIFTDFGLPNKTIAGTGSTQIQNLTLAFDQQTGNLTSRTDGIIGLSETFGYDVLDRLTNYGPPSQPQSTGYFPNGNIQQKSDIGTYSYSNTQPNAVEQVTNSGSIITAPEQDITFNSFNKPQTIVEGTTDQVDIIYGPDQQRTEMDISVPGGGGITGKVYYLTNYEMQIDATTNTTTQIHYVNGGDGLCAMYILENGVGNMYYVFKDHLGSILKLTDNNGVKIAEQSFDAWGAYRNPTDWSYTNLPSNPNWMIRGYTGHEHLPQFSLINMNARVYDPKIARMLSADNYVTDQDNAQAYNRYSYCKNNPLNSTDLSGNWDGWGDLAAFLVGAIVEVADNWSNIDYNHAVHWGNFFAYFGAGGVGGLASYNTDNPAVGFAVAGVLTAGITLEFQADVEANPAMDEGSHQFLDEDHFGESLFQSFIRGGIAGLAGSEAGSEIGDAAVGDAAASVAADSKDLSVGFSDFISDDDAIFTHGVYKAGIEVLKGYGQNEWNFHEKYPNDKWTTITAEFAKGFVTSVVGDELDNFSNVKEAKGANFFVLKGGNIAISNFSGNSVYFGILKYMNEHHNFSEEPKGFSAFELDDFGDLNSVILQTSFNW